MLWPGCVPPGPGDFFELSQTEFEALSLTELAQLALGLGVDLSDNPSEELLRLRIQRLAQ